MVPKLAGLNCPNCGAGLEFNPDGSCKYCQMTVRAGKFDWGVDSITLEHREPRGPQLTTNVEDVGLDDPIVYQANLASARNRFSSLLASTLSRFHSRSGGEVACWVVDLRRGIRCPKPVFHCGNC